jgi:hypothetical protein
MKFCPKTRSELGTTIENDGLGYSMQTYNPGDIKIGEFSTIVGGLDRNKVRDLG